jgi:uncharacterized LabA/DUF88 family protein
MKPIRPIPEQCTLDEPLGIPEEVVGLLEEIRTAVSQPAAHEAKLAEALRSVAMLLQAQRQDTEQLLSREARDVVRVGLFVDVANLALRSDDAPQLDYARLRNHVARNRRLVHARAYCPVHSEYTGRLQYQRAVAPVWGRGYKIITKPVKVFPDGSRKADLDMDLALDVVRRLHTMDVLALASGDGDFVPLVEYVQEQGVRVECYCYGEALSEDLRLAVDTFWDLHDYPDLHLPQSAALFPENPPTHTPSPQETKSTHSLS